MRVLATMLCVSTLLAVQPPATDGPRLPVVDAGACPFEGCHYGAWTTNDSVSLRRDRNSQSPIAIRLAKGVRVTALTGDVVIQRAGRVAFTEPTDLLSTDSTIHAVPGDTLYLLSYIGEGFVNAWFKGRTYREVDGAMAFFNGRCDTQPDLCTGKVVQPTQSEWWVKIRTSQGRVGWTNEAEKFDGKDLYGR